MPTLNELKILQALPLEVKVKKTEQRIKEWYNYWSGQVYVSFSGGKDSTVLLHIARQLYPDIEAVYIDTGLEYPDVKYFVKQQKNITLIRPEKTFLQVIKEYGYPVVSKKNAVMIEALQNPTEKNKASRDLYEKGIKRNGDISKSFKLPQKWLYLKDAPFKISAMCCNALKKYPAKKYEKKSGKKPLVATMAVESDNRQASWLKTGCNSFNGKLISRPMSFWTENDILEYITTKGLTIPKCYGDVIVTDKGLTTTGMKRTGCMFCMFGVHREKFPNRFQRMEILYPQIHRYCMETLGIKEVLEYLNVPYCNPYIQETLF